jgi:iron complex outermembrane receptor protein
MRATALRSWQAAILVVLLWRPVALIAQMPAEIAGAVKDATGAPLTEVKVRLLGPASAVVETGPDGRFRFTSLPEGEFQLAASLAGFAPATRTIQLGSGQRQELTLTLSVLLEERTLVTAAKAGEADVQRTPIAISVLQASELQRLQVHGVGALNGLAPGVTFSQNSDYAQLTIRGIGGTVIFAGSDPSSAVYVDGVYIARPVAVLADFLDLERVEVLRGPQGTLYGRNAVGGAINVITRTPTNTLDASARVSVGNASAVRAEGRVSGPLVRNRVLASAAFLRRTRDGFVNDVDHPERPLGSEDTTSLSSKVHVLFNRQVNLMVAGDVTHKDPTPLTYAKVLEVKPGFQVDNPAGFYNVRTSSPAANRTLQFGGTARFTAQLPFAATLTSVTAFRKLDFDNYNDADITELNLTAGHVREIQHQWSEEITVAQQRGKVSWIAGLFVFDESDRQPVVVTLGSARLENRFGAAVAANAAAFFGQATVQMTDRLSATMGLRHSHERKSTDSRGETATLDAPGALVPGSAYAFTDSISHSAWTPKLGVELRARENMFTYVSATRGFKSGGFNLTSRAAGRGYAPEFAWSYEGGLKTTLGGGAATVNVAAFHTDYSDLQVQRAILPGIIDIANAAAATIRGIEAEGSIRLGRGTRAGGHLAWLDARYDQYVAVGGSTGTTDVAGNRLNNAPAASGRAWVEWSGAIPRAGTVSLRADSRWQSTVYFTPFNDPVQRQRPYGVVDVSAELKPRHGNWSVGVWARNLTSARYIIGTFSSPPPAIGGRPGEPLRAGVEFTIWR